MFKCVKMLMGSENQPAIVYQKGKANEKFEIGEAVILAGGVVTKATSLKPKYIIAGEKVGELLPCYLVSDKLVLEAELNADPTDFVVSDKLILSTNALGLGIKDANGVAVIHAIKNNAKVGDTAQIIFE